MGYRTVVVLNNDHAHEWANDPLLGRKIRDACTPYTDRQFKYGHLVEETHADVQSLVVLDGYHGTPLCYSNWNTTQTDEARNLALLKALADSMGYRIHKKPK